MTASEASEQEAAGRDEERRMYTEMEREAASGFDRALITLSGGALVLSVTFIRQIAPTPEHKWALVFAWIGFGIALLMIMFSFLTNQEACRKLRETLDWEQTNPGDEQSVKYQELESSAEWWRRATNWLNYASAVLFMAGVTFMAVFTGLNLPSEVT